MRKCNWFSVGVRNCTNFALSDDNQSEKLNKNLLHFSLIVALVQRKCKMQPPRPLTLRSCTFYMLMPIDFRI